MLSLRLVGVCLSGCGARTAAFVHATTGGGAIRHDVAPASCRTGVYRTATSPSPQVHHAATKPYCFDASRGGGRSPSSSLDSITSSVEEVMGQDSGEMFDVFLPPVALCALSEPPRPAGFSKARGLVHADGDWHRSVHIWLHSSKGEMVLQKRSASKDTFPGMWDVSVGGHFTSGEDSLETAIKETQEELGLSCNESSLRFVCTVATTATGSTAAHGDFVCNEYKDIYLMRYDGPVSELNFSPSEVEDVKLIPMDQLKDVYAAQDPTYIPRPEYYTDPLFKALREALR